MVVAGTHGKTTTTSIAAWVCEVGGLDPTFLVGGVVQNFGQSFRVTDSNYFVIEGDEYDTAFFDKRPKFMSYMPEIAIVNNIEFDHADIYKDLDAIKWQFSRLMNLVPGNGRLICGIDSPVVGEVLASMEGKLYTTVETFGLSDDAKWQARDLEFAGSGTKFKVYRDGEIWGEFTTKMIGEFNVRNCSCGHYRRRCMGHFAGENAGGVRYLSIGKTPNGSSRRRAWRNGDRRFRTSSDRC